MGAGKILIMIGALLTLVSTFFLSLFHTGTDFGYGLGFIFNIPDIMENTDLYAFYIDTEEMVVYIVTIVFIVFLLAGILQLIGLASRVVAIIGSIIALGIGILFLLVALDVFTDITPFAILLVDDAIADGIFPFDVALGDILSLGTITLIAGGALGLIGGIMGSDDF